MKLWKQPIDELAGGERAELHLLIELGVHSDDIMEKLEEAMADITALQAAIAQLGADATTDHDAILAAFTGTKAALDALNAQVATLTAGQVDQAAIDALTTAAAAADAAFNDAAAAVAPVVVAPPVQPATPTA
jgi:hypothetical protein